MLIKLNTKRKQNTEKKLYRCEKETKYQNKAEK